MLDFSPQDLGAKEPGRIAQCKASGLEYKEAAQFFTSATLQNFQGHYNSFIACFPQQAQVISKLRPMGIGPGEMLAWFLFDNITVGGANARCDLSIDGVDFAEMKAGHYCLKRHALEDFKLSRDQDPSVKYIIDALSPKPAVTIGFDGIAWDYAGKKIGIYNSEEFAKQVSEIIAANTARTVDIGCREKIVESWKDLIFTEYLSGKTMAMIQTSDLKMRYFGQLTKEMVGLHRIHRNQPWARVYLPRQDKE